MNTESDIQAINRVHEMATESLPPHLFEQWQVIKETLYTTRRSLLHTFRAGNGDFCMLCGNYLTHESHKRVEASLFAGRVGE